MKKQPTGAAGGEGLARRKILFYGTSSFAVPILKALIDDGRFEVVAVVTQPDRPVGRHAELQASPVKQAALLLNLPVKQFEKIKDDQAVAELQDVKADAAVVASFGQIIPQRVLDLYARGMVNVHGSLLPKYRGASPIAAAIKNGDRETGVTIMKMDALMDHGPTLALAAEPIRDNDTSATLEKRLAILGAKVLPDILFSYLDGQIKPIEQNHDQATAVKLLSREDGLIDWSRPADEIERAVRAYQPWPGTYAIFDNQRLKIHQTAMDEKTQVVPGTKLTQDGYPGVACGDGRALKLIQVQPQGKSVMDGKAYLAGHPHWA